MYVVITIDGQVTGNTETWRDHTLGTNPEMRMYVRTALELEVELEVGLRLESWSRGGGGHPGNRALLHGWGA